jgi:dimethylamine/trimethylamine dehydrogenase
MLADIPDLWDVNLSDFANDAQTARFQPQEGYQEPYINFVKQVTSKPVVGVGRFTSVDAMVSQVRRGVLDLVGAARPSIADPYFPEKVRTQHIEEIRECIGCNICVSSDSRGIPIRCTQNPTIGEEWRRGWHPEKIEPKVSDTSVLVVGSGPAGLECSLQLANRGYQVTLAEAGTELGGRVTRESQLNGLSSWVRVRDYREQKLKQMVNVEIYLDSELKAQDILEFGFPHVILATGAQWRRDGVGRSSREPIKGLDGLPVYTPDDIMSGKLPEGRTVIYDDDQAYMGGVLAEHLVKQGREVSLVTPASIVSPWTEYTLEQGRIQSRLIELGVELHISKQVSRVEGNQLELQCAYSGNTSVIDCDSLVVVTERLPNSSLADELNAEPEKLREAGIESLEVIGDGFAPGLIVDAVYAGHLAARSLERDPAEVEKDLFRREIIKLDIE